MFDATRERHGRLDALGLLGGRRDPLVGRRLRRRRVATRARREPQGSVPVHEARHPRDRRQRWRLGRAPRLGARGDRRARIRRRTARRRVRSSTSRSRPRSSTRPTASASTWSRRRRPTRDSSRASPENPGDPEGVRRMVAAGTPMRPARTGRGGERHRGVPVLLRRRVHQRRRHPARRRHGRPAHVR